MKLMELSDKFRISEWAYYQCRAGYDTPEMRKLITSSDMAIAYCRWIKYRPEIAEYVNPWEMI